MFNFVSIVLPEKEEHQYEEINMRYITTLYEQLACLVADRRHDISDRHAPARGEYLVAGQARFPGGVLPLPLRRCHHG